MKFNLIALSALVGLAAAATETTTSNDATITLGPEAKCAQKCDVTDRCCVAACYKVPCPSDSQANDTNKCVAACPQGNGSPSDSQKFADCEQSCYSSHFFPATAGGSGSGSGSATETGSSGTVATGVSATETGTSTGFKSSSNGATSTGSSASGSSTGAVQTGAAANVKLGSSGAGLVGLALAAFAL